MTNDKCKTFCVNCEYDMTSICMGCWTKINGMPSKYCEIGSIPKKNNAEMLKAMNIDQLAEWLDANGHHDAIWWKWFEKKYCDKCESETVYVDEHEGEHIWKIECECAYCEVHDKCRFFQEMDDVPDSKETIKLWLEANTNDI